MNRLARYSATDPAVVAPVPVSQPEPSRYSDSDDNEQHTMNKKERILLYVAVLLFYILVTHPSTFLFVNKLLGKEWVSPKLESQLDTKIIFIHGLVLLLLLWGFCTLLKKGTFRGITE
jgi:hypothetical protein